MMDEDISRLIQRDLIYGVKCAIRKIQLNFKFYNFFFLWFSQTLQFLLTR